MAPAVAELAAHIDSTSDGFPRGHTFPEEIRAYRGTLTEPGKNSPYRDRTVAENLALRGQNAAAVREAKLAVDLAAKDAFSGPAKLYDLAKIYALTGREDEAIDLLGQIAIPLMLFALGVRMTGVDLSGEEPVLMVGNARAPFSRIEAVRDPIPAQQAPDPDPEDTGA